MTNRNQFKKTVFVLFFAISMMLSTANYAQNRSITFEQGTWQEVLDKAKKENKLIFMDAYTTWCGPCKMMAKNTFTKDEVADYFNGQFINAKFDMEKGEGVDLAKKYEVRAYPTLLFINGDGEKVHFALGYMDGPQLIAKGKKAMDNETNYLGMTKRYQDGDLSPDFVAEYAALLKDGYMSYDEVLSKYWATQKDFSTDANWNLISEFDTKVESDRYKYVLENRDAFIRSQGKKAIYDYFANANFTTIYEGMRRGAINKDNYSAEMAKVKQLNIPNPDQVIANADVLFYQFLQKDMTKASSAMVILVDTYKEDDPRKVNSYAWTIYEKVEDTDKVAKAASWMQDIVLPKERSAAYLDTYAALLFKQAKYAEAEKIEMEAIDVAKKTGEKTDGYEKMLAKIKAAM